MTLKEIENLVKNYDTLNRKRLELLDEYSILDSYTGVKSAKLDAMIAGNQGKSMCDRIEEKIHRY